MKIVRIKASGLYYGIGRINNIGYFANGYTRLGVIEKIIKLSNVK